MLHILHLLLMQKDRMTVKVDRLVLELDDWWIGVVHCEDWEDVDWLMVLVVVLSDI